MSGAPGAHVLFDVVFFTIIVGSLLPGATVRWVTRKLRVQSTRTVAPAAIVSLEGAKVGAELGLFFIEPELAVASAAVDALPLPRGAAITMIERVGTLLAVSGSTVLEPGDYAYVLYPKECADEIELLFGPPIG